MNEWDRRMPRSSAPQPGESLAGYLLNLAHRLDLRPQELIRRTGLKAEKTVSLLDLAHAFALPSEIRSRFATATGLTEEEAVDLTLERYGERLSVIRGGKHVGTLPSTQWLPIGRTRFCPDCLADTPDTAADHPVWRIEWLTGWAVACTKHGTLLLDACPSCGIPVGDPGRGLRSLIPHITRPIVHPASCRATQTAQRAITCGTRLDHALAAEAHPDLLVLQQQFDDILADTPPADLTSLGVPVSPTEWLGDLRLITILLQVARDETPFDAVPYGDDAARFVRDRVPNRRTGDTANRTITQPPDNPPAAAGLFLSAVQVLADPNKVDLIEALSETAGGLEPEMWKRTRSTARCSDAVHTAVRPAKYMITDPRKIRLHAAGKTFSFGSEHVPAFLDDDTFQRHFSDITARRFERPLRRFVPIALVRMVSDLSVIDAGALLGYEVNLTHGACARASDAFDTIGHHELRRRLVAIAAELDARPLINFRRRRDWFPDSGTLSDTDWDHLQSRLAVLPHVRANTPWDERRPVYEAWAWSLVTQGDLNLAPVIQVDVNGRKCIGDVSGRFYYLTRRSAHHDIVHAFAAEIAATIDTSP